MEYHFYGHEIADKVHAVNKIYEGVETALDLYNVLSDIWCPETCAPRMRAKWTPENKTLGQCSISAFLAQDIFGGEVYGVMTENGNLHCYNKVGEYVFDLASEQFGDKAKDLVYDCTWVQDRESEDHFLKNAQEKRTRYEYLISKMKKI